MVKMAARPRGICVSSYSLNSNPAFRYFRLPGTCVNVEPAADRTVLLDPALLSDLEAAVAASVDVTFVVFRCDRAEPAADLAVLLVPLSRKTLDAADAARPLVTSVFAIVTLPLMLLLGFAIGFFASFSKSNVRQAPVESAQAATEFEAHIKSKFHSFTCCASNSRVFSTMKYS